MSPLGLPKWKGKSSEPRYIPESFGDHAPAPVVEQVKDQAPHFIGKRNEYLKETKAQEKTITIEVMGVKGLQSGNMKVPFQEGQSLDRYLEPLGLKMAAVRSALNDMTNLGKGRLRLYYIPEENAVIRIGSPAMGVQSQHQRVSGDGMKLALNMKGKQVGAAMNVAEFDMRYRPAPPPRPEPKPFEDDLDVDQV